MDAPARSSDAPVKPDEGTAKPNAVRLLLGPLLFGAVVFLPGLEGLQGPARYAVAVTAWMAAWWITEALPVSATALLPIVLFPMTGVLPAGKVTLNYGHPLIFLFLGGFALSAAIQKWNLHQRIALRIIHAVGVSPARLVLGFLLATGFISMWISNTATALMMTPIGIAVIQQLWGRKPSSPSPDGRRTEPEGGAAEEETPTSNLAAALMLSIAYGAAIGGMGTIIGSPPNAIFVGYVETALGGSVTFLQWMALGAPLAVAGMLLCWAYLTYVAFPARMRGTPAATEAFRLDEQLKSLGPMGKAEVRVAGVFLVVALLWVLRGFLEGWLASRGMGGITDTSVAVLGILLLMTLPSGQPEGQGEAKSRRLLDWDDLEGIPWGILILFGGGLALAQGLEDSGAAQWAAQQLAILQGAPYWLLLVAVVTLVMLLGNVMSNTSAATLFMPVMAGLARGIGIHPYLLLLPVAMATSCDFLLPVGTPPNAIVFASGYVRLRQMIKAGLGLSVIFVVLIAAATYWWLPLVWGISP